MALINKTFKNKGESGAIPLNANNLNEIVSVINTLDNNRAFAAATLNNTFEAKVGKTSIIFDHLYTNNNSKFELVDGNIKYKGDKTLLVIFKGYCSEVNGSGSIIVYRSSSTIAHFNQNTLSDTVFTTGNDKIIDTSINCDTTTTNMKFSNGTKLLVVEL